MKRINRTGIQIRNVGDFFQHGYFKYIPYDKPRENIKHRRDKKRVFIDIIKNDFFCVVSVNGADQKNKRGYNQYKDEKTAAVIFFADGLACRKFKSAEIYALVA